MKNKRKKEEEKRGEEQEEKEMKRKEEGENEVRGRNKHPPETLTSSLDGHTEHTAEFYVKCCHLPLGILNLQGSCP